MSRTGAVDRLARRQWFDPRGGENGDFLDAHREVAFVRSADQLGPRTQCADGLGGRRKKRSDAHGDEDTRSVTGNWLLCAALGANNTPSLLWLSARSRLGAGLGQPLPRLLQVPEDLRVRAHGRGKGGEHL